MKATTYKQILKDKLKVHTRIHNCNKFQQDGAPCHQAKMVKQWFRENGIEVLDWPGNSPDLNPIENLWTILKKKVSLRRPTNTKDLQDAVQSVWCLDITMALCKNLVDSMPKRIKQVLKNNGRSTKY